MIQEAYSAAAEELVGALDALDVPFLRGGVKDETALRISPARLMQGLASAPEARMRSAIIPLLLRHPEFAREVDQAAIELQVQSSYVLELFYTAALLLQRKYATRIEDIFGAQERLPDLFSESLGLELSDQVEETLRAVGARHAELSGLKMNWVGGYEHAARTWLEYIELEVARKKRPLWQTR